MPVPTYPSSIAASNIQTEFGGANPIAISEYYSGGTYVGSGTANSTGTVIPTSGLITYLNFSGAAAVTIKNWWYDRLYPDSSPSGWGVYTSATKLRANSNSYVIIDNAIPASFISRQDGTYANSDWTYDIVHGASSYATSTPIDITSANNSNVYAVQYTAPRYTIHSISPNGTKNWTSNTTNTLYGVAATNSDLYVCGRGTSTFSWLTKLSVADGTTRNWTHVFGTSAFQFATGSCLIKSRQEDVILLLGSTNSNRPGIWWWYTANNTFGAGGYWNPQLGQALSEAPICSNTLGNNFPIRFSSARRDVAWVNFRQYANPYVYDTKLVPSGNVTVYITQETDTGTADQANTYLFTQDNEKDLIMNKIIGNTLSVSWSRRISSTRTGDHRVRLKDAIVTTSEIVLYLSVESIYFDTKYSSWQTSGYVESHILRVPTDGTKTGTRANLSYSSISNMSLSSNTNLGGSVANTPANGSYAPVHTSNTMSLISNSAYNINGTAI